MQIKVNYELLDQPVTVLSMNPVTRIALMRLGINHLGELVQQSKIDLESKPWLGPRSVDLLEEQLREKGLSYGMKVNYTPPELR